MTLRLVTKRPPKLPKHSLWAAYRRQRIERQLAALIALVLDLERRIEALERRHEV